MLFQTDTVYVYVSIMKRFYYFYSARMRYSKKVKTFIIVTKKMFN